MTEFQALITGMISGALMKQEFALINVEVGVDESGNYTNEILITGRNSGERLLVTVEALAKEEL